MLDNLQLPMAIQSLLTKFRTALAGSSVRSSEGFFDCMARLYFERQSNASLQKKAKEIIQNLPKNLRKAIVDLAVEHPPPSSSDRRSAYLVRPAWEQVTFKDLLGRNRSELDDKWALSFILTALKYSSPDFCN